jgi:hypothetical protein
VTSVQITKIVRKSLVLISAATALAVLSQAPALASDSTGSVRITASR